MSPRNVSAPGIVHPFGRANPPIARMNISTVSSYAVSVCKSFNVKVQLLEVSFHFAPLKKVLKTMCGVTPYLSETSCKYDLISFCGGNRVLPGWGSKLNE